MTDEYEIFDNEDIPEYDIADNKKKKIQSCKTVISCVIAGFLTVMSVANFILCIMLYNKLDDLQLGAQFYFQNSTQTNPASPSNIIVEQATEYNIENEEITTVLNIETVTQQPHSSTASSSSNSTVSSTAVETTAATTSETAQTQNSLVNINTATAEELTVLSGIGTTKAQAIVDYRKENGKFLSVEDITDVSGIGEKTFEKIKDYITVE